MIYDLRIEATDSVTIVHEQMDYWRRRNWSYAEMVSAVTGWNVKSASREVAFDILLLAWRTTQQPARKAA